MIASTQQLDEEIRRLRRAVEELTVLNELAVAASSSVEVNQMLDTILKKSIKALKAEQGTISLVTEQQKAPLKTLIRFGDSTTVEPKYRIGDHITGWVLKYKKPLMIENLAEDKRFITSEQEKKEIHSVLCVPIWCKAKIIGVLMLTNKRTGESFNKNDLRLLSIIAPQSGQLILNSQLQEEAIEKKRMQQELAVARHIQMSLLPKQAPTNIDIDIANYFNPAEEVGGDYYDFLSLPDERIGIVAADVSGHGPPAAMMMTMVKGILHSVAQNFTSADQVLHQINTIITRIAPKQVFITAMFMEFDLKQRVLRFSNAGHTPLIHYNSQNKQCQLIECKGCALNLTSSATFLMKEIPLEKGDLYFLYTDGVTEATNDAMEMFEENRVIQGIEAWGNESAATVIDHLREALSDFTAKKPQEDDILMMAVKIT
jgi:sigma-B regulation protein RsbU (phosphoserine phosphatase)